MNYMNIGQRQFSCVDGTAGLDDQGRQKAVDMYDGLYAAGSARVWRWMAMDDGGGVELGA